MQQRASDLIFIVAINTLEFRLYRHSDLLLSVKTKHWRSLYIWFCRASNLSSFHIEHFFVLILIMHKGKHAMQSKVYTQRPTRRSGQSQGYILVQQLSTIRSSINTEENWWKNIAFAGKALWGLMNRSPSNLQVLLMLQLNVSISVRHLFLEETPSLPFAYTSEAHLCGNWKNLTIFILCIQTNVNSWLKSIRTLRWPYIFETCVAGYIKHVGRHA